MRRAPTGRVLDSVVIHHANCLVLVVRPEEKRRCRFLNFPVPLRAKFTGFLFHALLG